MGRLTVVNSWYVLSWFVDKKEVSTFKKVLINGTEYPVKWRYVSVPYDDMGHTYEGSSWHAYVKEPTFNTEVSLESILDKRIKVEVVK